MQRYMSTQALLDELAARERRVLQQLHELSGINQSPITPHQAYTSVQATPRGDTTPPPTAEASAPPSPLRPVALDKAGDFDVGDARTRGTSRGTIKSLEHDLQRLQYLLRHSPLHSDAGHLNTRQEGSPGLLTPTLQRYGKSQQAEMEGAVASAHEKRFRWSPVAHVNGSPVEPGAKRDRRETLVYAPPPLLDPLPPYTKVASHRVSVVSGDDDAEVERAMSLERAASPRRSTVLDMTDEEEDGACRHPRDNDDVQSPRGNAVPRGSATMLASRGGSGRSGYITQSSWQAYGRNEVPPRDYTELTSSGAEWRRSPIRWVASSALEAEKRPSHTGGQRRDCEEVIGRSALDIWDAHHFPERVRSGQAVPTQPSAFRVSPTALGTPPPPSISCNEASQLEVAQQRVFCSVSPPPRFPGTRTPSSKVVAHAEGGNTAIPTPVLGAGIEASLISSADIPCTAQTPPPTAKMYNMASTSARRAASVLPRGVTRTTSWRGLRAFFSRQSRVLVLRTPALSIVEESEPIHH
jgi:hypothetical protein